MFLCSGTTALVSGGTWRATETVICVSGAMTVEWWARKGLEL